MARRRRAKNNLLLKMIGVAILINAILLPILATLGVFKPKKGVTLMEVKLIKLPPEKKIVQKKPPVKKVAKARPRPSGHRQVARQAPARPSRPNPNQPKVVAQSGGGKSGAEIENNGTGAAGVVPTQQATPPATAPTPPPPSAPPAPIQAAPQVVAPTPPAPTPPAPVFTEAVPVDQPQPEIPDDLLGQDLHAVFDGYFTIHPDGTTDVKMVQSTGNPELDGLALQAAKKWTFRPGTKDGVPIDSYRRLEIRFDVSS
jgi:protein TonB